MKKALSLSLAAALSLSLLTGCTAKPEPSAPGNSTPPAAETSFSYADTIAWNGAYDVVVVGYGGAGATAAATAADEGAKVLLLEKAPQGYEGGNTRYCGQFFAYGGEDEEATYTYYKTLASQHEVPDAMLRVFTKNVAHMYDVMANLMGLDKADFKNWTGMPMVGYMSPEYPEFPGSDKISANTLHEKYGDGYLWQQLSNLVTSRSEQIDVWFESPATHLIQDPQSKTIVGVQVERGGETLNIRAENGVVLATGGFENNPEMLADYLGITRSNPMGTLYNTGDGVRMAQEIGASLWHMEAYEGYGGLSGTIAVPEGERGTMSSCNAFMKGASIYIAGDGSRILREDETSRHGHTKMGDAWVNARRPLRSFIICDEAVMTAAQDSGRFPTNPINVQHAVTLAELAALIDVDAATLADTVARFNRYAKSGVDEQFGRAAENMAPIQEGSLYAIEVNASMLNTQGGPRRNENAEVLGLDGNPIPHLYSAGELGGITSFQYNGGSNIAECVIFGQIAGANAASVKDPLPAYKVPTPVESTLDYTPGAVTDLTAAGAPDIQLGENEYLGMGEGGMGGPLYVKVTMDGDKIAKVEVVQHAESAGISDPALEKVPAAIVEANSADVDSISGATMSSTAIKNAVKDALSQIK